MNDFLTTGTSPLQAQGNWRRGLGAVFGLLLTWGIAVGFRPSKDGPATAAPGASYGALAPVAGGGPLLAARLPIAATLPTNAPLTVIQSELFPATLWRSSENRVRIFANLDVTGLGGPTFLSYSSPTGIATLRPGDVVDGAEMRENWLLASFPGARGWVDWDSPWAVFLQRHPTRIQFETNGVELQFIGPAAHFAMMPLYGYYKPPQEGHEFRGAESGSGAKDKERARAMKEAPGMKRPKLQTWEWPLAVARDPLTRLRYWAGATRFFPVRCDDTMSVDRDHDAVIFRQRFEWLEIPDDWGTRPIRIAPVSPTLGLVLRSGGRFPVDFSKAPFDFEMATPYGPFYGVPGADGYDLTFPVLQYVNETEAAVSSIPSNAPPVVTAALERLRSVARARFPAGAKFEPDSGGASNFRWSVLGDQWYFKALPYYDPATRSNAVSSLGRYMREEVLVPRRFVEREYPAGSGRTFLLLEGPEIGSLGALGDAGKFSAALLQTIWAYAHFTGDRELVRQRWPLIRRLFVTPAQTRWAGFGRDEIAELGDEAAPALAFARLAYLAGDLDAYHFGCGIFARELVHLHVKQRGAAWFREQQPWHSMEPIGDDVFLTHLRADVAGWQMDGPRSPAKAGQRQSANRWVRFQDLDVARFYREHLRQEIGLEFAELAPRIDPKQRFTDDSHLQPSLVRLESFLLGASAADLGAIATPDLFQGPPSGVIASCLAVIRSAVPPRFERLIPGAPASAFVAGLMREVPGPNPHLVQSIGLERNQAASWPRIQWWGWKTPTGDPWNFGEVRAGDSSVGAPTRVQTVPLNWNTQRIDVGGASP